MLTKTNEIAVRLYDNKFYGTTYGRGLYRKALYNGSIDIKDPAAKYVVDLYSYNDWAAQAKTTHQTEILDSITKTSDKLYSWLYRYNSTTKQKTLIPGCCTFDLNTNEIDVVVSDDSADISNMWQLEARPCRPNGDGKKVPQLLATNTDLNVW